MLRPMVSRAPACLNVYPLFVDANMALTADWSPLGDVFFR